MKTIVKCIYLALALLIFQVSIIPAQRGKHERLLDALVKAKLETVYFDDGAADATVTETAAADPARRDAPAEVRAIMAIGPDCIPLLIAHLDDTRLTRARFDGSSTAKKPVRVPLGHLSLDILVHAIASKTILVDPCVDDGLGACVNDGYYFRPDVLQQTDGTAAMRAVKAKWLQAYRQKRLRFKYPTWLKRN